MTLGEFISKVEQQTGTSITDPRLLEKDLILIIDVEERRPSVADVQGDVIVLEG